MIYIQLSGDAGEKKEEKKNRCGARILIIKNKKISVERGGKRNNLRFARGASKAHH